MSLPARDSQLVQIMDIELARVARISGPNLACRPGCTQCCHGAFTINALDAARLRAGMESLRKANPAVAARIEARAHSWLAEHGPAFPGNPATGILGTSEAEQEAFEDFANDAPCPALDPATGLCEVYDFRPMTCRVFGPPVRVESGNSGNNALACCELCFVDATEDQIATCEMHPPHALESELLSELGSDAETVVAFALLPTR
jgi:Fe-S-cluster containining protein